MIERTGQTLAVARLILKKPKTRHVTVAVALVYLSVFLLATGDLGFHAPTGFFDVQFTPAPLERMFNQTTPFRFEGIAIICASVVTHLFSPINLLIASCYCFWSH